VSVNVHLFFFSSLINSLKLTDQSRKIILSNY